MEHVKKNKVKNLNLNEVIVVSGNQKNMDEPLSTTRLMYEAFLDANHGDELRSSQKTVKHIENELDSVIADLKNTDPEIYNLIIDFKQKAELNSKSPEEIESFIRKNLAELPAVNMYKHLYSAHVVKIESDKKKDYELHEVLDETKEVDLSTIYHALLYRSASVRGGKEVVKKVVEKSENCLDTWLEKIKENDPEAYAIMMEAYHNAKNSNLTQQEAIPNILTAIDELKNIEPLQTLMQNIQQEYQIKETVDNTWSKAYKVMAGLVVAAVTATGSMGGTLGGLFGASKVPVVACTLGHCLALMNVTIGS